MKLKKLLQGLCINITPHYYHGSLISCQIASLQNCMWRPLFHKNYITLNQRFCLIIITIHISSKTSYEVESFQPSNPEINIHLPLTKKPASAGNRTRINCLEGSYADHYTTDAYEKISYCKLSNITVAVCIAQIFESFYFRKLL